MNLSKASIPCLLALALTAPATLLAEAPSATKTPSPVTVCLTIDPTVAPSSTTGAPDRLVARTVRNQLAVRGGKLDPVSLEPGSFEPVDLTLPGVAESGTLSKGRSKLPFVKCDSQAQGGPRCTCSGARDCVDMGKLCVPNSTSCNDANQDCSCAWNMNK